MQCKSFFKDVAGDMADFDSPFDTLATLAGVLSSDEEMVCKHIPSQNIIPSLFQVSLELGTLCKKYPDVTHEQLLCLLLLRGDLIRG